MFLTSHHQKLLPARERTRLLQNSFSAAPTIGCQTNQRQQCLTAGAHPTTARSRFPMDSAGPSEDRSLEAASATESAAPADSPSPVPPSRYESQKRRDWNTFLQYLRNHKPPLTLARCSGAHVIEFLKYLDQFGKTKVHNSGCPYFGHPNPPAPCGCLLKQAWGSLDALIGRLRAAYEENGGRPESNPFAAKAVRIYLREVKEGQAKARGIPYEKKKRKRPSSVPATASQPSGVVSYIGEGSGSAGDGAGGSAASTTAAAAATTTV